jgi:hypothetical protein
VSILIYVCVNESATIQNIETNIGARFLIYPMNENIPKAIVIYFFSRLIVDKYIIYCCRSMIMSRLKVVLLTEAEAVNSDAPLPYKYYGQKLWNTIRTVVNELNYRCESVDLHKLDFQEHESVNKFLGADIVIMVR